MSHDRATTAGKVPAFSYKKRLGVVLFWVYALIYTAFVAVNLAAPALMDATFFAGLNVAVVYGFGLIVLAFILAIAYNRASRRHEAAFGGSQEGGAA